MTLFGSVPAVVARRAQHRSDGDVPVVIFRLPRVRDGETQLGDEVRALACRTAGALAAVDPYAAAADCAGQLRAAAGVAQALNRVLGVQEPPAQGEATPVHSASQPYFRVRTADLTDHQALRQSAGVLARAAADLAYAPVAASDLALEARGMCTAILDLAGVPAVDLPAPVPAVADAPLEVDADLEGSWARRWLIGHHVRFLFEACAATALTEAAHYLGQGCLGRAVGRIGAATVFVQAFPAAVAHACAMPAEHYLAAIRPGMAPPVLPQPLSGRMHRTYTCFRQAMRALLACLPEPHAELSERAPDLAQARNALLHADLIDAERHIAVAYAMLATRRSLAQPAGSPTNAVTELRQICQRRIAR
jgi:hypothetical protein